jgi:hypothetical protein
MESLGLERESSEAELMLRTHIMDEFPEICREWAEVEFSDYVFREVAETNTDVIGIRISMRRAKERDHQNLLKKLFETKHEILEHVLIVTADGWVF